MNVFFVHGFGKSLFDVQFRRALEPSAKNFAGADFVEQTALHDFDACFVRVQRDVAVRRQLGVQSFAEISDLLSMFLRIHDYPSGYP